MADEETKQVLRELLATQKEHLELVRGMNDAYEEQCKAYEQTDARWHKHMDATTTANRVAYLLRAAAIVIMAVVIAYLVFFGLHKH